MKLSMHGFQPLLIDMCIDLRCRDVRVAEHFLDDAQIRAIPEKMSRETVPEKVGINVFFQSGAARVFFYDLPDTCRG